MENLLHFREAHIVSDLHLGGKEGFQIFGQAATFKKYVEGLTQSAARPIALVINGDLVDFLAEPSATYFDAASAPGKLDRIASDPAFAPVFDALRQFVGIPENLLAITLGNHDIELALPSCRERLLQELSHGDPSARGRILLSFEGAGFRCRVGNADVLCLHGNEVDSWNVTHYEALRTMCRDSWCGRDGVKKRWIPSAGTQLVIEVMNPLKERYRWIDLLKPEKGAVPDVLLALDEEKQVTIDKIVNGFDSFLRKVEDAGKMFFGFLGEEEESREPARPRLERARFATVIGPDSEAAKELLWKAERRFIDREDPYRIALADAEGAYLSLTGIVRQLWRRARGDDPKEALRKGLRDLIKDRSFEWNAPDDPDNDMDDYVGPEIDFLIAGHTHLRRALKRRRGSGWYFNSGTWASLIRLDPGVLADREKFQGVAASLQKGTAEALREADLIDRIPTVVSIVENDGRAYGELRDVRADGSCDPVRGTRFTKA